MGSRINKVLLISPRYTLFKNDVRRCTTPLGLLYLTAVLECAGYEVKIIDAANEGYFNTKVNCNFVTYGLDNKEIIKRIEDFKPDVVGVSCIFSTQYENAKDILRIVKEVDPFIITLIGGSHPTYAEDEVLNSSFIDYIILNEGELPTIQLLSDLNKGQHHLLSRIVKGQFIENLSILPFPARHLVDMEMYFKIGKPQNPYTPRKRVTQIMTSRGCVAKCVFCTTTNFWGNRYRERSAENVIAEIRELKEQYNIDEIQFTDDNFTVNKKRAIKILEGIKDLGLAWCAPQGVAVWTLDDKLLKAMKESGCYQLTFGIESGNQEVLKKIIKKPLRLDRVKPLVRKAQELGIAVHAFCICGLPGETINQMHETYSFVRDCEFDSASFFLATPLVGSRLLDICKENNYLENTEHKNRLYKIGNITTPDFKAREVQELVEGFNKAYNSERKLADGKY